jgi:alkylhydroperoxidase family enzyme
METMSETPRIEPLAHEDRDEEQHRLMAVLGSEKHIFSTLVRHPLLFADFQRFGGRLLLRSALPDQVRETLILRTAYCCRAAYEWVEHVDIARGVGLAEDTIAAAGSANPAPADEHAALLIRAADQLTADRELDDATWTELARHYDERQMIELCMLVGNYAMIAGVLKSLKVELEDGQTAPEWHS